MAYETFDEANKTCERVEVSARVFDVKSAEITAVATAQESLIHAYVDNSTKLVTETLNISDVIENETDDFKRRVTEANKTVSDINSLVVNASNIMETSDRTGERWTSRTSVMMKVVIDQGSYDSYKSIKN